MTKSASGTLDLVRSSTVFTSLMKTEERLLYDVDGVLHMLMDRFGECRKAPRRCSHYSTQEEDDLMLRRFLRARDHNVGKACAMLVKYVRWKREAKPNGFISEEEVAGELAKDMLYLQGYDRQGRPLIYGFANRHYPSKRDLEEFKRYVIYVLDKTVSRLPSDDGRQQEEKFVAVADFKGWGYSNCDIRGYLAALDIMQSYYPERLARVFLIHVPYVFMAAWKMIYPFIDDNTKKKFVFVADKDLRATLKEAIDDAQLAEEYGGKLKLVSYSASSDNYGAAATNN